MFLGDTSAGAPEFQDRFFGYQAACAKAGIAAPAELHAQACDSTETIGFDAINALLDRGSHFDGIFAASDLLAIGAMRALTQRGLKVPDDVAVVGYDDIPAARYSNPPLSTILQDTKSAGQLLVETLVRLIRREPAVNHMLSPKLVVRQSCGSNAESAA